MVFAFHAKVENVLLWNAAYVRFLGCQWLDFPTVRSSPGCNLVSLKLVTLFSVVTVAPSLPLRTGMAQLLACSAIVPAPQTGVEWHYCSYLSPIVLFSKFPVLKHTYAIYQCLYEVQGLLYIWWSQFTRNAFTRKVHAQLYRYTTFRTMWQLSRKAYLSPETSLLSQLWSTAWPSATADPGGGDRHSLP